jgi:peptidoglycan hydrolase-like protein with peptidoglycan-binding domain
MRSQPSIARGLRVRLLATVCVLATTAVGCAGESGRDSAATSEPRASTSTTRPTVSTTTSTTVPPTTTTTPPPPPPPLVLRRGAEGIEVQMVQARLAELGFRPGNVDGHYGDATYSAVMAFQKHEGLDADGHAGPITMAALGNGLTRPGPRGGPTPRVEVDIDRQIAFVVAADGTTRIINVSSGNGERYARPQGGTGVANTPRGTYEIERRIDGVRVAPLGRMYRPMYFKGGFALHGSSNVPGYPASHGCVRTTNTDQDYLWDTIPNGARVEIYPA